MVDLNGHEAGNGGYSQRKPIAHRVSSLWKLACNGAGVWGSGRIEGRGLEERAGGRIV
jgi:hypothetical protein